MEVEVIKLSSNSVTVQNSILSSFPVNDISKTQITVPEGFEVIQVNYSKPFGGVTETVLDITIIDVDKKVHYIKKKIRFALSENQRVADAVSPSSFRLRNAVKASFPPASLGPSDFIAKYNDLVITSVDYKKPGPDDKEAIPLLSIRTRGLTSIIHLPIPISFNHSLSEHVFNTISESDFKITIALDKEQSLAVEAAKYIGNNNVKVVNTKLDIVGDNISVVVEILFAGKTGITTFSAFPYISETSLLISRLINRVVIKPGFADTYPPAKFEDPFVDYPSELKITNVKYYPPKDFDSVDAQAEVSLLSNDVVIKHYIDFKFKKSLKDQLAKITERITGSNFKLAGDEEMLAPPTTFSNDQFECDIPDVDIEYIDYDFKKIEQDQKKISFEINALFRGAPFKVKKEMVFKMSYVEYVISQDVIGDLDLSVFSIPQQMKDPIFIKELQANPEAMTKKILSTFSVSDIHLGKVAEVTVSQFSDIEENAEIIIVLEKVILGKTIRQDILFPIIFTETYVEVMLLKLTEKGIEINENSLTSSPPDNLNVSLFRCNPMFNIYGIEYFVPGRTTNKVTVVIKLGAGKRFVYIEKFITYELTREQYWYKLEDEEDQKFIDDFDPSRINIHVNILGEPVEDITKSDLSGVPDGIGIYTKYTAPPIGELEAELIIGIKKGNASKSFRQIIKFERPKTKAGTEMNQAYTQMMQLPRKK